MTSKAIRKKLINYIADAGDRKVRGLYMLVEDEISGKDEKFQLATEHLDLLDYEREKHIKGKTRSYSWEDAKKIIRSKKS